MTHFSLFSGIGGLELAAEWAGFETVGQCEFADYPYKILCKHWPDVPKWRDIRDVTAESFYQRTGKRTVDIISGGFPCQPFSVAGKQKGKEDDRYLWPEMLRVIRELKPRWVIGENVPGILRIAGDTVCQDLEREGYDVGIFDYEAAAVGAPHRRERIFFVANRDGNYCDSWRPESAGQQREAGPAKGCNVLADTESQRCGEAWEYSDRSAQRTASRREDVADTDNERLQRRIGEVLCECAGERAVGKSGTCFCDTSSAGLQNGANIPLGGQSPQPQPQRSDWWTIEPDVGRVATGIPNRVDRLKCLGNAVVPQQAYPLFAAIAAVIQEAGEG